MTMFIPKDGLDLHWPHAIEGLNAAIAETSEMVLPKYRITTPLRLAHFLAQLSVECDGGQHLEENLRYTHAAVLMRVWPRRFPTVASTDGYINDPHNLALKVYGGRMGNRPNTDDGWTYRGRGPIQITGRSEYADLARISGLDLVAHPELANAFEHCLDVAGAYWKSKDLNVAADEDDIEAVTILVNGGYNGLADRIAWLKVWKEELAKEIV